MKGPYMKGVADPSCEEGDVNDFVLSVESDIGFTRIEAVDIAGDRNDLNYIQELIGGLISDNNGWALFAD